MSPTLTRICGMAEMDFMQRVRLTFGRGATRLFRCNAGMGWVGRTLHRDARSITLGDPRPFHGMPEGTPDLIGWHTITITPDMVGRRVALFVVIETKAGRRKASDGQARFVDVVQAAGGVGVVARTEAEIAAALRCAGGGQSTIPDAPENAATGV